jgi:hypothetical protein
LLQLVDVHSQGSVDKIPKRITSTGDLVFPFDLVFFIPLFIENIGDTINGVRIVISGIFCFGDDVEEFCSTRPRLLQQAIRFAVCFAVNANGQRELLRERNGNATTEKRDDSVLDDEGYSRCEEGEITD